MEIRLVERLAQAEKHVADGRRRLDCQRELVLLIKESGRDTQAAENLLEQLAAAHALNLAKLKRVQAALERLNAADAPSSDGARTCRGPASQLRSVRSDP
jgi:hypothetical protein